MLKKSIGFSLLFIAILPFCYGQQSGDSAIISPASNVATLVIFRTFDFFNFGFNYRLFASDSLLGRIRTHDVMVINTDRPRISFSASIKAPSLNAGKKNSYIKTKRVAYQVTLRPGTVYFVQCGFLKQKLFEYPRQPTVKLIKGDQIRKCLRKGFVRRKLRRYLYQEWLIDHNLAKYENNTVTKKK